MFILCRLSDTVWFDCSVNKTLRYLNYPCETQRLSEFKCVKRTLALFTTPVLTRGLSTEFCTILPHQRVQRRETYRNKSVGLCVSSAPVRSLQSWRIHRALFFRVFYKKCASKMFWKSRKGEVKKMWMFLSSWWRQRGNSSAMLMLHTEVRRWLAVPLKWKWKHLWLCMAVCWRSDCRSLNPGLSWLLLYVDFFSLCCFQVRCFNI